jgi:putative polyhydroxyalkanoate system protein
MSVIDIQRSHSLGQEKARSAADTLADKLANKFGVQSEWQGDRLVLQHNGITGHLDISETDLRVRIELGMMLRPFKSKIENEIETRIDRVITG